MFLSKSIGRTTRAILLMVFVLAVRWIFDSQRTSQQVAKFDAEVHNVVTLMDSEVALHYARESRALDEMFENMRGVERSQMSGSKMIDTGLGNPLGFRTPKAAMAANDMLIAIKRGRSPAPAYFHYMHRIREIPESGDQVTTRQLFELLEQDGEIESHIRSWQAELLSKKIAERMKMAR